MDVGNATREVKSAQNRNEPMTDSDGPTPITESDHHVALQPKPGTSHSDRPANEIDQESPLNRSQEGMAQRMGLNDNKAGMQGLDKEKINKLILQASKGIRLEH